MNHRTPHVYAMPNEKGSILRSHPFDAEIAQQFCDLFGEGRKMAEICAEIGVPKESIILWLARYPAFLQMFERAREVLADLLVEEAQTIADDDTHDLKEIPGRRKDEPTRMVPDWENVQRSRLKVDFRKWRAAKLAPRKYGDKLEITGEIQMRQIDDTMHGRQLRVRNLIEEFKQRGGDPRELFAVLGLNEINLGPDFPKLTEPASLAERSSVDEPASKTERSSVDERSSRNKQSSVEASFTEK